MAPPKWPPEKLGFVARNRNRFRAQLTLDGKVVTGPGRERRADAIADLGMVRACRARKEIPTLLARLRAEAGPSDAPPVAAPRASRGTTASSAVARHVRSEVGSPAVSRRTRAVDGTPRPPSTTSTDHAPTPRNLESAFENGPQRRRLRGTTAGPSPGPQAVARTSSSGMAVLLVLHDGDDDGDVLAQVGNVQLKRQKRDELNPWSNQERS